VEQHNPDPVSAPRLPYHAPRLVCHGTVLEVTKSLAGSGKQDMAAGTTKTG